MAFPKSVQLNLFIALLQDVQVQQQFLLYSNQAACRWHFYPDLLLQLLVSARGMNYLFWKEDLRNTWEL